MDICSGRGDHTMTTDTDLEPGPRDGAPAAPDVLAEPPRRARVWKPKSPEEIKPPTERVPRVKFGGDFQVVEDTRRVSENRRLNWDNEPFIQALREGKTLFVPYEDDARAMGRSIAGSYYARLRRFGLKLRIHSEKDGVVVWALPLEEANAEAKR
jgi:hypothetical protein